MLEVFRTSLIDNGNEQKIEFTMVLLVKLAYLPLHLIGRLESLQFDLYDKNVFYAIGSTNEAFEQSQDDLQNSAYEEMAANGLKLRSSERARQQFRIEKFFIDCEETFQSQTMCFLQMPEPSETEPMSEMLEEITMYQNSQGHELVAVVTNKQSIYVYSLEEMRQKYYNKQKKMEKNTLDVVKEHLDHLAINTEESHDA